MSSQLRNVQAWVQAFAGKGFTSDDVPFFDNPGNIYNFGMGVRYDIFTEHKFGGVFSYRIKSSRLVGTHPETARLF